MNNPGEVIMCSFCLQPDQPTSDMRKLACDHLGCLSCIGNILKATQGLECPTCSFKSEVADINKLECLNQSSETEEQRTQLMCGVCNDEPAVVFCVKCQKPLCSLHEKDDDVRAESNSQPIHYRVKSDVYVKNRHLYIRHYCKRHSDTKTALACSKCLDLFCSSCVLNGMCSSTTDVHKLTSLPEAVIILRNKINEFQVSLAEQSTRCQSLLKDTYKKVDLLKKTTNNMIAEVDRIMKEQIQHITQEGEKVKMEISKKDEEMSKIAEGHVKQVISCNDQLVEQMSNIHTIRKVTSPGHMVEKFSAIESGMQTALSTELLPLYLPYGCLVSTGRFRSLETKLSAVIPSTLQYNKTSGTGSTQYFSVKWISNDCMVTASSSGIMLMDEQLKIIKSINIPGIYDIVPYGGELIVLQTVSNDTQSIQRYSMQLEKINDIVKFSSKYDKFEQIAAVDFKVVATDSANKCIHVWTIEGKLLKKISRTDMSDLSGVCATSDGCVLVTNFAENGSLRKYKIRGDNSLVWRKGSLLYPMGTSVAENGDIYVNGGYTEDIVIYQLSPNGILQRTCTCDQLRGLSAVYGLSCLDGCLAVACGGDGIKLFQLISSV